MPEFHNSKIYFQNKSIIAKIWGQCELILAVPFGIPTCHLKGEICTWISIKNVHSTDQIFTIIRKKDAFTDVIEIQYGESVIKLNKDKKNITQIHLQIDIF